MKPDALMVETGQPGRGSAFDRSEVRGVCTAGVAGVQGLRRLGLVRVHREEMGS
jgi:hypothetical protein